MVMVECLALTTVLWQAEELPQCLAVSLDVAGRGGGCGYHKPAFQLICPTQSWDRAWVYSRRLARTSADWAHPNGWHQ